LKKLGGVVLHRAQEGKHKVPGHSGHLYSHTAREPEVREAIDRKIPVIPRIEMLAELARLKYTIGVAGSHGKTSTTSMIGLLLQHGGFDPTVVIGGKLLNYGSNTRLGKGDFFVAEADEKRRLVPEAGAFNCRGDQY